MLHFIHIQPFKPMVLVKSSLEGERTRPIYIEDCILVLKQVVIIARVILILSGLYREITVQQFTYSGINIFSLHVHAVWPGLICCLANFKNIFISLKLILGQFQKWNVDKSISDIQQNMGKNVSLMYGSAFCDKNVQISSLYCSFTIFYSFLGQLLTSLLTNKKHMFFCVK